MAFLPKCLMRKVGVHWTKPSHWKINRSCHFCIIKASMKSKKKWKRQKCSWCKRWMKCQTTQWKCVLHSALDSVEFFSVELEVGESCHWLFLAEICAAWHVQDLQDGIEDTGRWNVDGNWKENIFNFPRMETGRLQSAIWWKYKTFSHSGRLSW